MNIVIKIDIPIFFSLSVIYSYSMNILSLTIYSNIKINNESIYIFINDSFFYYQKVSERQILLLLDLSEVLSDEKKLILISHKYVLLFDKKMLNKYIYLYIYIL